MVGLNPEKQIAEIEAAVIFTLHSIGRGGEVGETLSNTIWSLCRVYVLIHDCDLTTSEQDAATVELYEDVIVDRMRNMSRETCDLSPSCYAKPNGVGNDLSKG